MTEDEMTPSQRLAAAVNQIRIELGGIPWAELGRRADVDPATLRRIRYGLTARPRDETLVSLAEVGGREADALMRLCDFGESLPPKQGAQPDHLRQLTARVDRIEDKLNAVSDLVDLLARQHPDSHQGRDG